MRSYHQKQTVQGKTKGRKMFPRRLWMTLGVSGAPHLPFRGRIWVLQPQVWVPGSQCAGAGCIAEDQEVEGTFPSSSMLWSPGTRRTRSSMGQRCTESQLPFTAPPLLKSKGSPVTSAFGTRDLCVALSFARAAAQSKAVPHPGGITAIMVIKEQG